LDKEIIMSGSNTAPSKEAAALFQMTMGLVVSQSLYVAADLGIADHLANGSLTAQVLAGRSGSHPDALARLLRALVALGITKLEGEDLFALTPTGELLRSDVPGSIRATIRFLAGPWAWRAWENLPHSVRSAQPAFDQAWGMSNFDYWERHPDVSKIHDEAMEGLTEMESAPILATYDFSRFRKVVDVGGGNGSLLAALLRQHSALTGSLADLPHVVRLASSVLQRAGVANRCQVIECNFFESVPAGGDAYVLKSVIHNWDDARALMILRHCHRAIGASGTLLAMDRVLPEQPNAEALPRYLADLTMLAVTPGGRERTEAEFKKLLESAGFEFTRVIQTGGPLDIVEARRR
jgi:SAM-dependent methyltransferase